MARKRSPALTAYTGCLEGAAVSDITAKCLTRRARGALSAKMDKHSAFRLPRLAPLGWSVKNRSGSASAACAVQTHAQPMMLQVC